MIHTSLVLALILVLQGLEIVCLDGGGKDDIWGVGGGELLKEGRSLLKEGLNLGLLVKRG